MGYGGTGGFGGGGFFFFFIIIIFCLPLFGFGGFFALDENK
ncbi:hypothetical protein [Dethiothermospora halolimnae]